MSEAVRELAASDILGSLAAEHAARTVALLDTAVRGTCDVADVAVVLHNSKVFLITDEGVVGLGWSPVSVESRRIGGLKFKIVKLRSDAA